MKQCSKCREWAHGARHNCPPSWRVTNNTGGDGRGYGDTAGEAAEWYAEHRYEWDDREDAFEAHVLGADGWRHFKVEREWDPAFWASATVEPEDWEDPHG